jgi:hypothetical protein
LTVKLNKSYYIRIYVYIGICVIISLNYYSVVLSVIRFLHYKRRTDYLHKGHFNFTLSQSLMHLLWNLWVQWSALTIYPVFNTSKHIAQLFPSSPFTSSYLNAENEFIISLTSSCDIWFSSSSSSGAYWGYWEPGWF